MSVHDRSRPLAQVGSGDWIRYETGHKIANDGRVERPPVTRPQRGARPCELGPDGELIVGGCDEDHRNT
jgi:hypothetical protein